MPYPTGYKDYDTITENSDEKLLGGSSAEKLVVEKFDELVADRKGDNQFGHTVSKHVRSICEGKMTFDPFTGFLHSAHMKYNIVFNNIVRGRTVLEVNVRLVRLVD
jgi:hypothetical protein